MVSFRQHDDRHVSHKIKLMKWNTLMDLIAIGMKNGDVSIHRLVNWQKIWVLTWPNASSVQAPNIPGAFSGPSCIPGTSNSNPTASSSSSTTTTTTTTEDTGKSKKDTNENGSSKLEITAMEWRPDGKVLAVSYNRDVRYVGSNEENDPVNLEDSSIALVDIENGQVITITDVHGCTVTSMCWQSKNNFILNDQYKMSEEGIEDILKVASQPNLNLMAVGTSIGTINVYVFGIFLVGIFNIQDELPITHVSFTADLQSLSVIIGSDNVDQASNKLDNYQYRSFKLPFFKRHSDQYYIVGHIYSKTISLLGYLDDIISGIQETMEDILLELDSKLTSYLQAKGNSNKNTSSSSNSSNSAVLLADEFLELLVIGQLSDSLEKFLHQLTDKGLKKLGLSIEATYATIQKFVVCNVQRACKHIFSHFNVLRAISMWTNEFSSLGFKTEDINCALHGVATFYLKALELQQVIDSSCQNLRCFFRWLYLWTVRFYNDTVPSSQQESIKVSQQDLQYVADFIEENFDTQDNRQDDSMLGSSSSANRPTATNFTLERVCQYFKNEPLVYRTFSINDQSLNPWFKYLKERPMLVNDDPNSDLILFKHNAETSLMMEHKSLMIKAHQAFTNPCVRTSEVFTAGYSDFLTFTFSFPAKEAPKVTSVSDELTGYCYVAIAGNLDGEGDVSMIKFPFRDPQRVEFVSFTAVVVESGSERETIPLDIQFYSDSILSMLLITTDSQVSYLLQLPLSTIENNFLHLLSGCSLQQIRRDLPTFRVIIDSSSDISIRRLDNFKPSQFSVSGSRKVCCISSKAKRRVRIFEMDGNEEEVEEESEAFE